MELSELDLPYSSSASSVSISPFGVTQVLATGQIGLANVVSGLRPAYALDPTLATLAMLGLNRLFDIERLGSGSPEIGGGMAGASVQVRGSGMSIDQAIPDGSEKLDIASGCEKSAFSVLNPVEFIVVYPAFGGGIEIGVAAETFGIFELEACACVGGI